MKTFQFKDQARDFLAGIDAERVAGTYVDPKLRREPFGNHVERFLKDAVDLRPATAALYRTQADLRVLPAFRATPIGAIRPADVRAFVTKLQDAGDQPPTIQVAHRLLSRVLVQAVADGVIASNPAARARLPRVTRKPPRILTPEQIEGLADAIEPRSRALVLSCAYGGLRFGESAALRRRSVRALERRLDVVQALAEVRGQLVLGATKTGASRSIQIPTFLVEELAAHMAAFLRPTALDPTGDDLLFTDSAGNPIRRTNWRRRVWGPAVRAAELEPPPTPHDLRHTAAAIAIAQGAHPKAIQERLGHSSIRVTLDVYGHLFPSLGEELADRLDAVREEAQRSRGTQSRSDVVVHL